jgi:transposase InsO family protein
LIEDHRDIWPVRVMCEALRVSPSGYYAWRSRPDSPRKIANRALLVDIRRVHAQHRERYGAPRLYAQLRAEGQTVSRKRVERVMRQHGIRTRTPRRYRVCTTDRKHCLPVAANLLEQNFVAHRPDQVWLTDITYIPTSEGWLYLAVILDLFTRKVVGWAMSECVPNSPSPHSSWQYNGGAREPASSIIPIAAANTPPVSIATSCRLPLSPNQ